MIFFYHKIDRDDVKTNLCNINFFNILYDKTLIRVRLYFKSCSSSPIDLKWRSDVFLVVLRMG